MRDTECTQRSFFFHRLGKRQVVARFDGGNITSDGGAILLRQVEEHVGVIRQFAGCFSDHRDAGRIEHTLEHLLAQRLYGLALGNEDLNDHDTLRHDPLLAAVVGHADPTGQSRRREQDRGKALAGKSTLNRLELTCVGAGVESRYKKIVAHFHKSDGVWEVRFCNHLIWTLDERGSGPAVVPPVRQKREVSDAVEDQAS